MNNHRGYFAIGVYNPKAKENIGTLWRSAFAFGASYIFTIGKRYQKQPGDTTCAWKHIPLFDYESLDLFCQHSPKDCCLVGIEIVDGARPLPTIVHPERAIYLLGPEDGSLPPEVLERCQIITRIDTRFCLNVAVAGSIVMYDRNIKGVSNGN